MKQFAEYRVDILLVANMLHGEIIKGRLQVFILAPQGLMRPAGNFDIAVITHHVVRYYSYIEITRRAHQTLWREYEHLQATFDNFAMQHIRDQEDIYPVFRELFHKQSSKRCCMAKLSKVACRCSYSRHRV